jgi:cytochrome c-type biogenesis protein CcmH
MFWIVAFAIAVLAALFTSLPLLRRSARDDGVGANDVRVYRDQLDELVRDEQSGLIDPGQAAQAKAEIARRLIGASEAEVQQGRHMNRTVAVAVALFLCLLLPAGGALVYARMGSPDEADQPLAARMNSPEPDINILIAKTEAHLAANPTDGTGWDLLAPIYMRQMRPAEAATAYRNAIRHAGETAQRLGGLGEALAAAAQGQVDKEAVEAFARALTLDPADPRARFYLALADEQAGNLDKAFDAFSALARESAPDAPWQGVVEVQLRNIAEARKAGGKAPGNPEAADIEAAAGLSDDDRSQMIRTMVETLDERLRGDPDNFEGWMRLIRSYTVLNEPDKAKDAVKRGLAAFPAETDNGKAILALAGQLGLTTEDMKKQ